MKKFFIVIVMIISLVSTINVISFAVTDEQNVSTYSNELVGLVAVDPNARAAEIPTLEYDISQNGTYHFDGGSNSQTLYTLYYFSGCEKYTVIANNLQSSGQKVIARNLDGDKLEEYTIPADGSITFRVTTTEEWYLEFPGGGIFGDGTDVYGTVSKYYG
ncbi:MAG: hypothetical protein IJW77_11335 [Clostridia bacterium]|nr:hypothetical protein [Clostridia bacterium]